MKQVFVVGTVHAENGQANPAELVAILERIQPEVVFLEAPVGRIDEYLEGPEPSLEAIAVSHYRQGRSVELVAVDRPTPVGEFFHRDRELNREIEVRSPEYCRAIDLHSQYTYVHGFHYLNSEQCAQLGSDLRDAMLSTLRVIADPRLDALFQLWLDTNRLREEEMMTNIERQCRTGTFRTSVLLTGAAHRPGLMRLARERAPGGDSGAVWDFNASLEP